MTISVLTIYADGRQLLEEREAEETPTVSPEATQAAE